MFSKKNFSEFQLEKTMHSAGSRKLLVSNEESHSPYWEAMTYGFLEPNEKWDMHNHVDIVEICLVTKGKGEIKNKDGEVEQYEIGDRFIFPPNVDHEILNTGDVTSEFYFIRVKSK